MKHIRSVLYMFVITLVFAAGVSGVKQINNERITLNQNLKLRKVILKVLDIKAPPGADDVAVEHLFEKRVKSSQHEGRTVYAGYNPEGSTVTGYAFPVSGSGVWGTIHGMVAVSPDGKKIIGLSFYKHSETPGLGGRIAEAWFRDQFKGLKLEPAKGDHKIFRLKPEGTGTQPSDLDAITGASLTSAAVELFLNKELNFFLTKLWGSLKEGK